MQAFAFRQRCAFTIVELLVVVCILAMLLALLLPAIYSARAASLKAQCSGNLRQIGTALQAYVASHGVYPPAFGMYNFYPDSWTYIPKFYSAQSLLLPHLGEEELYSHVNFERPIRDVFDALYLSNSTAGDTVVRSYMCPADAQSLPGRFGGNNYCANIGDGAKWRDGQAGNGLYASSNGAFGILYRSGRASEYSDGLSLTAAFSERVKGGGSSSQFTIPGDYALVASPIPRPVSGHFSELCRRLDGPLTFFSITGYTWLVSSTRHSLYDHGLPPNSEIFDCGNDGSLPPIGVFAARSLHDGGVNVLTMDGAVHFIHDSIEASLWRALSTREGGEVEHGRSL